jgi:hypothetical protein
LTLRITPSVGDASSGIILQQGVYQSWGSTMNIEMVKEVDSTYFQVMQRDCAQSNSTKALALTESRDLGQFQKVHYLFTFRQYWSDLTSARRQNVMCVRE